MLREEETFCMDRSTICSTYLCGSFLLRFWGKSSTSLRESTKEESLRLGSTAKPNHWIKSSPYSWWHWYITSKCVTRRDKSVLLVRNTNFLVFMDSYRKKCEKLNGVQTAAQSQNYSCLKLQKTRIPWLWKTIFYFAPVGLISHVASHIQLNLYNSKLHNFKNSLAQSHSLFPAPPYNSYV